jgi:glycosyltransferase involved in cell wall biosynthesis
MNAAGGLHIVYLYADSAEEWNCSEWRCHLLANAINAKHEANPRGFPHTANLYSLRTSLAIHHPSVQSKIGVADIIVFQRDVIAPEVSDALEYWRAIGKTVVVDLDDHYPGIPPSNPAHPFWIANAFGLEPPPVERMIEGLKHADALIAPSHVILKDWAHILPGYYWPNYPAMALYQDAEPKPLGAPDMVVDYDPASTEKPLLRVRPRKDTDGKVCIGWGGSISHMDSFLYSNVVPAIRRVLTDRPNVFFKFCGGETRLDWLLKEIPEGQFMRHGGVMAAHWPLVLSTFDIGIAPLDMRPTETFNGGDNPGKSYDERRSWLKLVEYICAGVPFVATNGAPYHDLGGYGKLVENTEQAWYEALISRVDCLAHFKTEARERRLWALKHMTIEANAERLIDLYSRIQADQQTRRLNARLPETIYVE